LIKLSTFTATHLILIFLLGTLFILTPLTH
jgi:hypothetical protein